MLKHVLILLSLGCIFYIEKLIPSLQQEVSLLSFFESSIESASCGRKHIRHMCAN